MDETETIVLRYPFGHVELCASVGVQLTEHIAIHGRDGYFYMLKPHYTDDFTLRMRDGTETRWHDDTTPNGFVPEAVEVMRCVQAGLLESPTVPHDLTIRCARVFDMINAAKEN